MRIGAFCAIPFLLALLCYASVAFLATFASASVQSGADREEVLRQIAEMRREIEKLQWLLSQQQPDPTKFAQLTGQQRRITASVAEVRRRLAELHHQIALLRKEIEELRELARQAESKVRSKEELEREAAALQERTDQLRQSIGELQTRLNELEEYFNTSKEPIVTGRGRDAVYVECTEAGARIMPDGIDLTNGVTPSEQQRLLKIAREKGMVFFLIRPDGYRSFSSYREVIQEANATAIGQPITIGFEPVDAESKLKYVLVDDYYVIIVEQ